ncbi:MAG: hypothetical protein RSF68_02410 [Myroides sp.]
MKRETKNSLKINLRKNYFLYLHKFVELAKELLMNKGYKVVTVNINTVE